LIVASMVSRRPRLTFSDSGPFPITAVPILECRSADPATPDPLIVIEQGTRRVHLGGITASPDGA
jgi:hypothetical protein